MWFANASSETLSSSHLFWFWDPPQHIFWECVWSRNLTQPSVFPGILISFWEIIWEIILPGNGLVKSIQQIWLPKQSTLLVFGFWGRAETMHYFAQPPSGARAAALSQGVLTTTQPLPLTPAWQTPSPQQHPNQQATSKQGSTLSLPQ